jgi:hypothetical protein
MRELKRWAWVAVVVAGWGAPASAQLTGNATSGGTLSGLSTGSTMTGGTGTGGISAGTTSGGGFNSGGGNGGSSGPSGNSGTQFQGTNLVDLQSPPDISGTTGTQGSSTHPSNIFSGYYANPYYQGRISAGNSLAPGGFGAPLYGTGTGAVRSGGTTRGATGTRGNTSTQSGIIIPLQVQMAYTAEMRFAAAPVAPAALTADLRGALTGTSMISNAKGIQIEIDAGNNVILRGTVADDDERRLAEGLVRVTPGVRGIKNELTVSNPTAGK